MLLRLSTAFAGLLIMVSFVRAEPRIVYWNDLSPPAVAYTNPFEGISSDHMSGLRELLRLRLQISNGEEALSNEAAALQSDLEDAGLDVEWLFAKRLEIMEIRESVATGVNEELVGTRVRIPGYLLPLEVRDRKAVEFLLVPTVGACIHTPPPPPNQVVHVIYPEGVEIFGLYDPIWIEGDLQAQATLQDVRYVDGEAKVHVSYGMHASAVSPYNANTSE